MTIETGKPIKFDNGQGPRVGVVLWDKFTGAGGLWRWLICDAVTGREVYALPIYRALGTYSGARASLRRAARTLGQ